jgi:hypothetical protein
MPPACLPIAVAQQQRYQQRQHLKHQLEARVGLLLKLYKQLTSLER